MKENNIEKTNFLFYKSEDGSISVQVVLDKENDTIWTTQKGMAELFEIDKSGISRHIANIYKEGELPQGVTVAKIATVVNRGIRGAVTEYLDYYNLDMVIAVGYRVNSYMATQFRIWATKILKEYLVKGFALDDERLKKGGNIFGKDTFAELLERIREIRASERMFYEKITDIFRDCSLDYDPKSPISQQFYAAMQNKFHYAIHQHTASEIIKGRADATKPYMGLTSWKTQKSGGKIYKSDVIYAKNYLSEDELRGLNRLVNMFLDYAEHQAERGKGTYNMADWAKKLDMFLNFNDYPILTDKGKVQAEVARRFAEAEYSKFRITQDKEYKSDFNRLVEETKKRKRKDDEEDTPT